MFIKKIFRKKIKPKKVYDNCILEPVVELSNKDYIAIKDDNKTFYGGRQNWWNGKHKWLCNYGCGVVAMADLQSYILGKTEFEYDEYIAYIEQMYKKYYHYMFALGVPFWKMVVGFFRYMLKNKKRVFSWWGPTLSKKKLQQMIYDMLKDNKPIPAAYYVYLKFNGLMLYRYNETSKKLSEAQKIRSHYFVITGIVKINGVLHLKISSWGDVYYINFKKWLKKISPFNNILYWKVR